MRGPIVVVMLCSVFVALLLSILPVQAANGDSDTAMFYALSRVQAGTRSDLKALPDDNLAAVVGAAGGFSFNLGIIVQTNVCAICNDVRQSNLSINGRPSEGINQGGLGFPVRR